MPRALTILVLLAFQGSVACSDDTTISRDTGTRDRAASDGASRGELSTLPSCSTVCDRVVLCGGTDRTACLADCERSRGLLQPSAALLMAACTEKPCGESDRCTLEAQKQCTALPGAVAVADAFCAHKKQCVPATDLNACKGEIEASLKCLGQAGLDRMLGCIGKTACESFESTLAACMTS